MRIATHQALRECRAGGRNCGARLHSDQEEGAVVDGGAIGGAGSRGKGNLSHADVLQQHYCQP